MLGCEAVGRECEGGLDHLRTVLGGMGRVAFIRAWALVRGSGLEKAIAVSRHADKHR